MRKAVAVSFLLFLAGSSVAAAEGKPVARIWVNRFDSAAHLDDAASAIAVDGFGNLFVAGFSRVPSFQTGTNDSLMIKYSASGEALWTNHFPTVSPIAIATDTKGNVFITGTVYREWSSTDIATMAFSGTGAPLWTNVYASAAFSNSDTPNGMALDRDGDVYVVGFAETVPRGMHMVIKYANAGQALWTNYFSGGNLSGLNSALCVDVNGDVIAAGSSIGADGYSHYQTVKFTSSGVPLWTNWYYGPGNYADVIAGVASDGLGNVYVTGTSWGKTIETQEDIATIAYSASGVALWTNRFDGPAHDWDQAARIGANATGTIVVTGTAGIQLGAPPSLVMVAYSATGAPRWTKYYKDARGAGNVSAIAFDELGNTLLAGTGSGGILVLKVSDDGKGISTNHFIGTVNDSAGASAIAAGRNGDFFVTGSVRDNDNGVVNWNFATLKYSLVDPIPLQIDLNRGQVVLSWSNPIFELQSTASLEEPFTDVLGAVSGYTTVIDRVQRFYRLVAP